MGEALRRPGASPAAGTTGGEAGVEADRSGNPEPPTEVKARTMLKGIGPRGLTCLLLVLPATCRPPAGSDPGPAMPVALTAREAKEPGTTTDRAPSVLRPGAPGQLSRSVDPTHPDSMGLPPHAEADVRFMTMMIAHHEQALGMTALVPERSSHEGVRLLARRIEASQADEIAWMRRWLGERGQPVPDPSPDAASRANHHAGRPPEHPDSLTPGEHARGDHPGMPGMLTPETMDRLAAASGSTFDRLFLESMIFHHEGAISMVEELFASPHGGQDGETFAFAAHVKSDQRIELARMRSILAAGL